VGRDHTPSFISTISVGPTDHFLSGSGGPQRAIQTGLCARLLSQPALGPVEILSQDSNASEKGSSGYALPAKFKHHEKQKCLSNSSADILARPQYL
jgi:hypothetical protein